MQTRLLAFLTEIEKCFLARRPELQSGQGWEIGRTVNYDLGLARMTFVNRRSSSPDSTRTSVLLQSFELADGCLCLKATLNWGEASGTVVRSVYAKPGLDWDAEAEQLAEAWSVGPTVSATPATGVAPLLPSEVAEATEEAQELQAVG
jgi:hypothetical protein